MKPDPAIATQPPPRPARQKAFTLPELLAVIAIMVLVMGFMGPAVNSIKDSRDIVAKGYNLAGVIEQARSYAIINNTYTWVGFYEEKGDTPWSKSTTTSGIGRVLAVAVASRDGSRNVDTITDPTDDAPVADANNLKQITPLLKLENTRFSISNDTYQSSKPRWPTVDGGYQVYNENAFTTSGLYIPYPLPLTPTATPPTEVYTFSRIIEFNPSGEASKVTGMALQPPTEFIGIGLQPTKGSATFEPYTAPDSNPAISIIVHGLTGRVQTLQP